MGIDALASTVRDAEAVGFTVLATATIASTAERALRTKGRRRTEHALLLEA